MPLRITPRVTPRIGAMLAVLLLAGACSSTSSSDVADPNEATPEDPVEEEIAEGEPGVTDVTVEDDSISFTVEGENGDEAEVQIGTGTDVPEGFPAPVPDGGEVQQSVVSSGSQGAWNLIVTYPIDRFDELAETYESWMATEGYETQKMEQSGSPRSVTLIGQGGDPPGVSVAIIEGSEGDVIVNLIVPN